MMSRRLTTAHTLAALALALLPSACGGGPEAAASSADAARAARPQRDPALAEVRSAIEKGRPDLALELLERVPGFEAECLRARAQHHMGDTVAALASLERARAIGPEEAELVATETELLASLLRVQAAADVLAEGMRRLGAAPPLLRAQGVLELANQGHAAQALEALERARARDKELPFVDWPLARAHVLVGRACLERAPAEATAHARAARALDPEWLDARELEAEGLTGELRFEEALALYAELESKGRDYGDTRALLEQRCATRCLLERDRESALSHYLAARELGMDDEGLGFGANVIAEERDAALARGIEAAEVGDWAAAEREFARALELDPDDLEAENHLAVARFQRGDHRGAAEAWERVLARSLATGTALPDPVPLNLAKAWRLAGERERARAVLSDLLDREPDGPLSGDARELLFVLEAEVQAREAAGEPR